MGISLTGSDLAVRYVPGESDSRMFGGNSNWRGPIWFPVNVLLTDSLRRYALGMAAHLEVEYPTDSGQLRHVVDIADDLDSRLVGLFRIGPDGRRPSDPRHVPTGPLWQAHPTSANTSMATPARAWAALIRPAGRRWSRIWSAWGRTEGALARPCAQG